MVHAESELRWPGDLSNQVRNRNMVLFIGAGVSMGSRNSVDASPVGWVDLLCELAKKICSKTELKKNATPLIKSGQLLAAAEYIHHLARKKGEVNLYRDTIVDLVDGPAGDRFMPSELHNALLDLSPSTIVTTNFDQIIERATGDGFTPMIHTDKGIDNAVRQGKNVILKLHGSVTSSASMVLTESDYVNLKREGSLALDVLQSLLLTKMALFVGYSFNDPDLKQILESVYGVPGREPGHVLVSNGEIPQYKKSLFSDAYGINVVSYTLDEHSKLLNSIKELAAVLVT